jgi:hypothetical protein
MYTRQVLPIWSFAPPRRGAEEVGAELTSVTAVSPAGAEMEKENLDEE